MGIPGNGINDLPIELVCNIFRLAIDPGIIKEDRCTLMLVCRQWRECVECSPILWTDIWISEGIPYVRRSLEKSKGAKIDIHCHLVRGFSVQLKAFMTEISPHIARWRSLTIGLPRSAPPSDSALAALITAQPPGLEILKIVGGSSNPTSENAITLFGGAPIPPTLKDLTLLRIPVSFDSLSLSGLESLDLVMVPTISTPQLLGILRSSPRLETLQLVDNPGLVTIGTQESNIQPIELPKLVSLSLRVIETGGIHCILSNIRIPNRRRVSIQGSVRGAAARSVLFTSAITHILHRTTPTIDTPSSAIRVEEFNGFDCSIKFRGIELAPFQVDGEDQIQEILRWIADSLGSEASACPVHLILDWSGAVSVHFATLPHPLVVKHLSYSDSMSKALREALYAAMVRPPHSGSSGWLFAEMESLSVGFITIESQKQLVSMLKSRYEGATSTGETVPRCPMNLRSVELRARQKAEGLVEDIRGILPDANVFWAIK